AACSLSFLTSRTLHLEFPRREFLKWCVQFELSAQFQRRGEWHFIEVGVGLGKIQQHVTQVFAQFGVGELQSIGNRRAVAFGWPKVFKEKFCVSQHGGSLKPFRSQ